MPCVGWGQWLPPGAACVYKEVRVTNSFALTFRGEVCLCAGRGADTFHTTLHSSLQS